MCKRCEFPVQITAVIAVFSLAQPALAVQDYEGNGRLRFFQPKPGILRFPRTRVRHFQDKVKGGYPTCLLQGNSQLA
jgi:hypothetical protein